MMTGFIARMRSLWRGVRKRSQVDANMDDEFRLHVEPRIAPRLWSTNMQPLAPPVAARSARSVWVAAFAISGVLHALVLGIRLDRPGVNRRALDPPGLIYIEPVPAMRAYKVVPIDDTTPTRSEAILSTRPPEAPPAPARPNEFTRSLTMRDSTATASVVDPAASRVSSSLWRRADTARGSLWDRLHDTRASVSRQIGAYNDSIAAVAEAARRSTYWTKGDENGKIWGVSPDAIHVGQVTVPLRICTASPCPDWIFSGPLGRRDEYERRQRTFEEIQQQKVRAEVREVVKDRVKALRARALARRDTVRLENR